MLKNGTAIPFHKYVCPNCHTIPKQKEWLKAPVSPGLHVFHIAKRKGHWEPIFIGTNKDPYYDERLSWEGKSDKMTQVKLKLFFFIFLGGSGNWLVHYSRCSHSGSQLLQIFAPYFFTGMLL